MVGTDATQTLTNKTIQGGTITTGTAVTVSGTSVDFTLIPSWVKRISVVFNGVSTNGTSRLQIQLGTSSGIETSSYSGSATNIDQGLSPSVANSSSGLLLEFGTAATVTRFGKAEIVLMTGQTWSMTSILGRGDSTGILMGGGNKTLGGVLDRIRITALNGTDAFDAGTINILYE
jgi:hypothetical protein